MVGGEFKIADGAVRSPSRAWPSVFAEAELLRVSHALVQKEV